MISHPFGPARPQQLGQARDALVTAGAPRDVALVLAAIGQQATGLDLSAVDTDQLHGRLAVGAWSINYYGPQYQRALQIGGPPARLAAANLAQQATVAVAAWRNAGLAYWPGFVSGAWRGALSAAGLRSIPAVIDGRPPGRDIQPTGYDAGAVLAAQSRSALASVQAATAAARQLRNTIGA